MTTADSVKKVLVLLIGEVLEDPRVLKTCRSLVASGVSVTVVCSNLSNRITSEIAEEIEIIRVPHYRESFVKRLYNTLQGSGQSALAGTAARLHEEAPASWTAAAVRNAGLLLNHRHVVRETRRIGRQMLEAVGRRHFDLVHANDVDTLAAGAALKTRGNARELLYDAHELWSGIGVHGSLTNHDHQRTETRYIGYADYVVTVNNLIADRMRDLYQLAATPAVVMNCPYLDEAPPAASPVHTPLRVLYQGKLQAFRGLEELVLAMQFVPGAELTFSGYGPIEDRLKLLVESEGLSGRVKFAGRYYPSDTVAIATGHDIGVLPFSDVTASIQFSSPNKLFDYLMAGLAIATVDLPFLAETVLSRGVGVVFADNTPQQIAEALTQLSTDPVRLAAIKRRSRETALSDYTWETQFSRNYPWKSQ